MAIALRRSYEDPRARPVDALVLGLGGSGLQYAERVAERVVPTGVGGETVPYGSGLDSCAVQTENHDGEVPGSPKFSDREFRGACQRVSSSAPTTC